MSLLVTRYIYQIDNASFSTLFSSFPMYDDMIDDIVISRFNDDKLKHFTNTYDLSLNRIFIVS